MNKDNQDLKGQLHDAKRLLSNAGYNLVGSQLMALINTGICTYVEDELGRNLKEDEIYRIFKFVDDNQLEFYKCLSFDEGTDEDDITNLFIN